jgi:hypothetical protein
MNHKQLTDIHIPNGDGARLALLIHTRQNSGSNNFLSKIQLQSAIFAAQSQWLQQTLKGKLKTGEGKFTSYPNVFTRSHPITRIYLSYLSRIKNNEKYKILTE